MRRVKSVRVHLDARPLVVVFWRVVPGWGSRFSIYIPFPASRERLRAMYRVFPSVFYLDKTPLSERTRVALGLLLSKRRASSLDLLATTFERREK